MTTIERIATILMRDYAIDESRATPGTRLNELGFDSLDWPDFWFSIEQAFAIDVDEGDPTFANVGTLGELAEAIDKIRARAAA